MGYLKTLLRQRDANQKVQQNYHSVPDQSKDFDGFYFGKQGAFGAKLNQHNLFNLHHNNEIEKKSNFDYRVNYASQELKDDSQVDQQNPLGQSCFLRDRRKSNRVDQRIFEDEELDKVSF